MNTLISLNICLFLLLFFVDVVVAKPKLISHNDHPADISEIVTFSCEYNITNVQVITVYSGNTILVTWEKGTGYTTVKKRIITTDFKPDSGVFNIKVNVSLCYGQLYYCRVYNEYLSSEDSEEIELKIVSPQVETSLDGDNPPTIEIENMNSTNSYNFSCSFDNVKNAVSIMASSENTSLIIDDVHSSINQVEEECRSRGSYNSTLHFEDYGIFVITCTVNTTDKISHSMEYKVNIVVKKLESKREKELPANTGPVKESNLAAWAVALIVIVCLLLSVILVLGIYFLNDKERYRKITTLFS